MATPRQKQSGILSILGILVVAASSGCSVLRSGPDLALDSQVDAAANQNAMVVVELRNGDKSEYLRAPLTDTMLVQDALKGSGAIQRFKRMDIVLVREAPNGSKIRLPVKYDMNRKQVADSNNYAMHAGDWLEVTRDDSTMLDRMLESAMEPFRPMMRDYRE